MSSIFHPMKFALVASAVSLSGFASAITLFSPDDFTNGDPAGWTGGNNPTVAIGGGPNGAGDNFLQFASTGGSGGSGSRLATYNVDPTWTGDYIAAGVTGIRFKMKNFGATDLQIRIGIFDGNFNFWTTTQAVSVLAGSDWTEHSFSLRQQDMTSFAGTTTYASTFSDVARVLIRHQSGAPAGTGGAQAINASVGLDRVEAVPEPATMSALALGLVAIARRRRSK